MALTVGDLARLTGVTVRALHHYDEIGLVRPSERSPAGYRLYSDADVHRLQQVLLLRELGLPLEEIAAAIDEPADGADRTELLRQHRSALVAKRARLDAMVAAVDATLVSLQKGTAMQPDDVKQMFEGFDPSQYEEEVKQRWGNTDAYKESARRTKSYGKAEWQQLKDESAQIYSELADLMRAGVAVTDVRVQAIVERHRLHIDRWFYPCGKDMQKGLAAMYVGDPRFAENLDKNGEGFAQYLADAIAAS